MKEFDETLEDLEQLLNELEQTDITINGLLRLSLPDILQKPIHSMITS